MVIYHAPAAKDEDAARKVLADVLRLHPFRNFKIGRIAAVDEDKLVSKEGYLNAFAIYGLWKGPREKVAALEAKLTDYCVERYPDHCIKMKAGGAQSEQLDHLLYVVIW
jgi:hypothetical protein